MSDLRVTDTRAFSGAEIGALLDRCFEGYAVPTRFTPEMVSVLTRTDSIDPDRSLVAWRGDEPVGVILWCQRVRRVRLGPTGVVKEARRQGVARFLVAEFLRRAREIGAERVRLEVIGSNTGAIKLYEGQGFRSLRRLNGFRVDPARLDIEPWEVEPWDAEEVATMMDRRHPDAPWPLEGESVVALPETYSAVRFDSALAMVAETETRGVVRAWTTGRSADGVECGQRLLSGLLHANPKRVWQFPPIYPSSVIRHDFEQSVLVRESLFQYEMEWRP